MTQQQSYSDAVADFDRVAQAFVEPSALQTTAVKQAEQPRPAELPSRRGAETPRERSRRPSGRFPCFDGLRALAAFAVVVFHVAESAHVNTGTSVVGVYTARLGATGVAIFFVISGFLLYRPYAAAHANEQDMPKTSRFYRHRLLRIFPAYWVAFTVFAFVLHFQAINNVREGVLYYGLFQIYDQGRVLSGMGQTWSLGTELGFYLLLPLVAWSIHGLVAGLRRRRGMQIEVVVVAGLFVLGVAFRAWLVFLAPRSAKFALAWAPARLDWFALGMLMAVASTRSALSGGIGRALSATGARAGAVWAVALALFIVLCNLNLPRGFEPSTGGQIMGSYALIGLIAAAIVLPAVFGPQDRGMLRSALRSAPAVSLGVISYGVFLWHMVVMRELVGQAHDRGITPHFWPLFAAVVPLTIIVATASYFLVEKPAMTLKEPGSGTALWMRVRHQLGRRPPNDTMTGETGEAMPGQLQKV